MAGQGFSNAGSLRGSRVQMVARAYESPEGRGWLLLGRREGRGGLLGV